MQPDWVQQELFKARGWQYRYRLATSLRSLLRLQPELLNQAIADSDTVFKHDRTTTVARITLADELFVLKRYNPRSWWHKGKRALRSSRARRCWDMSYRFQMAGLNVARPVLMFEQRLGPIRRNAYFMTRYLPGKELLGLLPTMNPVQQLEVVSAVRQVFNSMRAARLSHGDMKASNLLWVDGELFLIDLDASRHHRTRLSWRASSNKDRKRFIQNWQDQPELLQLFSDL